MNNNTQSNRRDIIRSLNAWRYVALAFCLGWCLAGCGDEVPMGEVSGQVIVDGKPAERGSVAFTPVDGAGPSSGAEILDGKYSAMVFMGKNKVEIRVPKVVGKQKLYNTPDSPVQDVLEEILPAKYNDQTELEIDVQKGKNPKDWELSIKD